LSPVDAVPRALAALYLALDFHPGGDLATQLARWGRLGRDRARFYICEIIDGVAGLHRAGIIYRCAHSLSGLLALAVGVTP